MVTKHPKFKPAITLVETMVAMVILLVASLGALTYRYHAAIHARIARAQMIATRTAQLLLEDWKSTGGSPDYDPTTLGLGFATIYDYDIDYYITVDGLPMYITLAYQDVEYDDVAEVTLREISVTVRWRTDYSRAPIGENDPSLTLATYVRVDAAGG